MFPVSSSPPSLPCKPPANNIRVYRTHTPSASRVFSLQLSSCAAAPEPLAYASQWSPGKSQNRYCEPPLLPRLVLVVTANKSWHSTGFSNSRCRPGAVHTASGATRFALQLDLTYTSSPDRRSEIQPVSLRHVATILAINICIRGGERKKKNANRI